MKIEKNKAVALSTILSDKKIKAFSAPETLSGVRLDSGGSLHCATRHEPRRSDDAVLLLELEQQRPVVLGEVLLEELLFTAVSVKRRRSHQLFRPP